MTAYIHIIILYIHTICKMVQRRISNLVLRRSAIRTCIATFYVIILCYSLTQITVYQSKLNKSSNSSFSKLSVEVEGSYAGLVSVSGGYSSEKSSSSLTEEGSELKISFKVRKVTINRPWMDLAVLHYPIVGVKGLESASWSNGELDAHSNNGSFPLLPTTMIVAKDVEISSKSFSKSFHDAMSSQSMHASVKVLIVIIYITKHSTRWGEVCYYMGVMYGMGL